MCMHQYSFCYMCLCTRTLLVCVPQEHHSPQHIVIDMDMHSCKGKGEGVGLMDMGSHTYIQEC